ncbi:uncharacterized protein LOC101894847 [Musca domestica]|uniref:Uncharacterized protein LOC101894847 n=1 Tax=Musca domestica TaxID=7370 RepID=A0A1I8NGT5_MUSDO|nr:uncharacterized protein LOC101894847 [Musca domestica]
MLPKHFIFCFVCFHIFGVFTNCLSLNLNQSSAKLAVLKNVVKLTDTLLEVSPLLNITISGVPPNCVQMLCKFVCFNGRSTEIDHDIDIVSKKNNYTCERIEELRLYNYEFPDGHLYYGFLGSYGNKVDTLYLASSNISDVAAGSFANGIFQRIYFEDLKLKELRKDFFEGISRDFRLLSIIQKEKPLKVVNADFLDYVKYQIKHLTMQVGLACVRNLTGSDNLLNSLIYVDFSFNDFGDHFSDKMFSKVSMVEHIDLSHSNLEYVPPYAFAEVADTLEYLDLSYNKLKTISRTIFGWHDISRDLKIIANDNEWECSCGLQKEMKDIFVYQTTKLTCATPANWSVFDDRICGIYEIESGTTLIMESDESSSMEGVIKEEEDEEGNTLMVSTTIGAPYESIPIAPIWPDYGNQVPSTPMRPDLVELRCWAGGMDKSRNERREEEEEAFVKQTLKQPVVEFQLMPREQLSVDVVIENVQEEEDEATESSSSYSSSADSSFSAASLESLNKTVGLIWFSKATTQYNKMEINYNEYGLGCYYSISTRNTVTELVPNVAYTFCIILKNQLTISPFNCKSIHVSGNLSVQSSAWLTRDMKVTGLSLVIFGIIMFSFAGILMIYLLLKKKPILLKGSKRVTTVGPHSDEIVVLPRAKSIKVLKEKENELARKNSKPMVAKRRKSAESIASYQSYMDTNLYEIIPAYSQISASPTQSRSYDGDTASSLSSTTTLINNMAESPQSPQPGQPNSPHPDSKDTYDLESCYLTPLNSTVSSSADLVNYAEIPYRTKRVSNDPLPAVPRDQSPFEESANRDIGVIYMLDSQV